MAEYQIQPSPTRTGHQLHSDVPGYAEGLWTPSVGGTATYFSQSGRYIKVGRLVFINCFLHVNVRGTGSQVSIGGLPFPAIATPDTSGAAVLSAHITGSATAIVSGYGLIADGVQTIDLYCRTAAAISPSSVAVFQDGTSVLLTGMYRIA